MLPVFLYHKISSPSPTAISLAAIAMMKSAKISPFMLS